MLTVLSYIGLSLGALIGTYMVYAVIVAVIPGLSVREQPLGKGKRQPREDGAPVGSRRDVAFEVEGTRVRGWLYLPEERSSKAPCVVMGHGLGGTMAVGLDGYARRYREAGFAVLVFDYRYLGESGGEPRQLVWIPHQLQDWAAAVEYARGLDEVNPSRVALWGTSLSGGHVIVAAARDHRDRLHLCSMSVARRKCRRDRTPETPWSWLCAQDGLRSRLARYDEILARPLASHRSPRRRPRNGGHHGRWRGVEVLRSLRS